MHTQARVLSRTVLFPSVSNCFVFLRTALSYYHFLFVSLFFLLLVAHSLVCSLAHFFLPACSLRFIAWPCTSPCCICNANAYLCLVVCCHRARVSTRDRTGTGCAGSGGCKYQLRVTIKHCSMRYSWCKHQYSRAYA